MILLIIGIAIIIPGSVLLSLTANSNTEEDKKNKYKISGSILLSIGGIVGIIGLYRYIMILRNNK